MATHATAARDLPNPGHAQPGRLRDPLQGPPLLTQLPNRILTHVGNSFELEVELREEVVHRPYHNLGVPKPCEALDLRRQRCLKLRGDVTRTRPGTTTRRHTRTRPRAEVCKKVGTPSPPPPVAEHCTNGV